MFSGRHGTLSALRFQTAIAAAFVFLGFAGRAYYYFLNPSLNHDDAALALNIIQRTGFQLRETLEYVQLAPWGFLLLERAVLSFAGTSESALRIVPLLASLATVPAFWYLAWHRLARPEAVLAVGFFSVAQDLVGSTVQVKQYSLEILATIVVLIAARPLLDESSTSRRWGMAAITGAVAIWFSFTSVFVLAAIGLASLVRRFRSNDLRSVVAVGAVWTASGCVYAVTVLRHQLRNSQMFGIWHDEFLPDQIAQWPQWLWRALQSLGSVSTSVRLGPLAAVALLFAAWLAFKSLRRFGLALVLTVLVTLLAACMSWYPFIGRFLFFATPAVLLLVFGEVGSWARTRSRLVVRAVMLVVVIALAYSTASFINRALVRGHGFDDPRGLYAQLRQNLQPGDLIHGSRAAQPSMRYYAPDLVKLQVAPTAWPDHDARVWFVFFWPTEGNFDHRALLDAKRSGVPVEGTTTLMLYTAAVWRLSPVARR